MHTSNRYRLASMKLGRLALAVLGCALLLRVVWFVAKLPESNCSSKPIGTFWNADRAFKATLLEKNCNAGETLFYSVRIDAYSPPLHGSWFVPGYQLEGDNDWPRTIPAVRWSTPRQLDVEVNTDSLAGSMTSLVHTSYVVGSGGKIDPSDDLRVVRKYLPKHQSPPANQ
jgi:hypothetical protein